MKKGWAEVALGDVVAEAISGFASGANTPDGVLQVRMNNVTTNGHLDFAKKRRVPATPRQIERFGLSSGDVLFNATNSPELVGKSALFPGFDEPVVFSNHFMRLRMHTSVASPAYVSLWLGHQYRRGAFVGLQQQWVNQASIRAERLMKTTLPLPPLSEQHRIARILDGAAAVASSARRGADLVDELRVSAFVEAVRLEKGAETVLVHDLVDNDNGGIRTGPFGSQLLHSEFVDAGVQVLGIDNAVSNEFRWGVRRFITEGKYAALKRYTVNPGDVLITIMGTCGRVAVVPDDVGVAINTKHLCCITLDQRRCLPEFLQAYFLHHPEAQRYLRSRSKGAIMDGLNMGIIKALPVILPPISSQAELVRRLAEIDGTRERMRDRNVTVGRLTAALTQRAFAGEL